MTKADAVRLSINRIASAFGKEDSYERNPIRGVFRFYHRIFRTSMEVLKCYGACQIIFDTLPEERRPLGRRFSVYCRREGDNFCEYRPIFRFVLAIPCIGRYNKLVILSASETIAADRK